MDSANDIRFEGFGEVLSIPEGVGREYLDIFLCVLDGDFFWVLRSSFESQPNDLVR